MIAFPDNVNLDSTVYLNGYFIKMNDARISPLDRGFLFADGVYEVVPVYSGSVFGFSLHFERLKNSLDSIQLKINLDKNKFLSIVNKLISKNLGENQIVYIQITRGVAKRNHSFPKESSSPTVFAMSNPLIRPSKSERENGVKAITMEDGRWNKCDIKSISLLANVLAREEAEKKHAVEAVLLKNKKLHEGAASTIWMVKDDTVFIPSRGSNLLEGVRIQIIKEICNKLHINFKRDSIYYSDLTNCEEIFMTSATKEVLAITNLDGKSVGGKSNKSKPGPIFQKIRLEYDELIKKLKETTK